MPEATRGAVALLRVVPVPAVHGPADLAWSEVAEFARAALGRQVAVRVIADDELRGVLGGAPTTATTLAAWAAQNLRG